MKRPIPDMTNKDKFLEEILEAYGAWIAGADLGELLTKDEAEAQINNLVKEQIAKELKNWLVAYQQTTGMAADPFILAITDRIIELEAINERFK